MTAAQRREAILQYLHQTDMPLSAATLAKRCSVSRQIIVGDIALLRAGGAEIRSTPRGYLIDRDWGGFVRAVVCLHTAGDMERELDLIVDNGCTVLDVAVEHPVYGQLTGQLQLSSRHDVDEFIAKVTAGSAKPLSVLTGGVHLHTLRCPDETAFLRVRDALDHAGFLVKE